MPRIHSQSSRHLQRVWSLLLAPLSAAHIACLLGSTWLHSTTAAVIGDHSMVLV
ncbi:hypothetical protein LEMLEM_LOCUS4855, partial [Lemmus lemmus]